MPHQDDEVAYTILLTSHAAVADFHGATTLFCRLRACGPVRSQSGVQGLCRGRRRRRAPTRGRCTPSLSARRPYPPCSSPPHSPACTPRLPDSTWRSGCSTKYRRRTWSRGPHSSPRSRAPGGATTPSAASPRCAWPGWPATPTPKRPRTRRARTSVCCRRARGARTLRQGGLGATTYVVNTFATLHARCGDVDRVLAAVSRMGSRDVAAWTMLIASYVQTGRSEDAIAAFLRMLREESTNSTSSNEYTFSVIVGFPHARSVANSLVKLYIRAGLLSAAVFRESKTKDGVSWSGIISGYVQEGLAEEAFALFAEMRHHSSSPRPIEFTLASLSSACASIAALDTGRQLDGLAVAAGFEHHVMVRSALKLGQDAAAP